MRPTIIECPMCEEPCGKRYPDSGPTYESGGEPGYDAGIGENFAGPDGEWYCSAECLKEATNACTCNNADHSILNGDCPLYEELEARCD